MTLSLQLLVSLHVASLAGTRPDQENILWPLHLLYFLFCSSFTQKSQRSAIKSAWLLWVDFFRLIHEFSVLMVGVMMALSRDFKCLLSKVLSGPHLQWSSMTFMHHKSHNGLIFQDYKKKKSHTKKALDVIWKVKIGVLSTSRFFLPPF